MIANVHGLLLRPSRFLLALFFWSFVGLMWAFLREPPRSHPTALLCWGIFFPAAFGLALASMLHEALHRPFALFLPNASRRLLRSHVCIVGVVSLLCGVLGHAINSALPLFALVTLGLAMSSLPLPFEPGLRWAGSRALAIVALSAMAAAAWFSEAANEFFFDRSISFSAIALGVAALNFTVAFCPANRRRRATKPFTSALSSFFDADLSALKMKEAKAESSAPRARWSDSLVNGSLTVWVKAVQYERAGYRSGESFGLLVGYMAVVVFQAWIMDQNRTIAGLPDAVYRAIFNSDSENSGYLSFLLCWLFGFQGVRSLRIAELYPFSRQRRARIAFTALGWQSVLNFSLVICGLAVPAAISAHLTGQPFLWPAAAQLATHLLMAATFFPLMQWCQIHSEVRRDRAMTLLTMLIAIVILTVGRPLAVFLTNPNGIAGILLAIILGQWALYAALKRFYLKGDLLQTGTQRHNFSLV